MSDYKTRLIAEKEDLEVKIEKLEDFLNFSSMHDISMNDQILLGVQFDAMRTYLGVLNYRVLNLKQD